MLRLFAKSKVPPEASEARQTQPLATPGTDWRGVSDIWYLVGKNIECRATLRALCKVSRVFYQTFSPLLYARSTFRSRRISLSAYDPNFMSNFTNLRYVQELTIDTRLDPIPFEANVAALKDYNDRQYEKCVRVERVLLEMIERMTYLKSFHWGNALYNPESAQLLHLRQFCQSLQQRSRLQYLYLEFSHHPQGKSLYDWRHTQIDDHSLIPNVVLLRPHSISGFKMLTSLELYSLPLEKGAESLLITEIAKLLRRSPGLKKLGLSIACEWDDSYAAIVTPSEPTDFLQSLALVYRALAGARPLSLETLRLGDGISVQRRPVGCSCLYTLFRKDTLKTFHISTGLRKYEGAVPGYPINMLRLPAYPNIRQLSVSHLSDDVVKWLNTTGGNVTELIITGDHHVKGQLFTYDSEMSLNSIAFLRSPLTLLYVREGYIERTQTRTVLDLLPSPSSRHLQSLAIPVNDFQYTLLLTKHLPHLPNLTALRLLRPVSTPHSFCTTIPFPRLSKNTRRRMAGYAKLCARYSAVKYIMVDEYAFEVVRTSAFERVDGGTVWEIFKGLGGLNRVKERKWRKGVKMRVLGKDQIRDIPIFAIREALGSSGLTVCEL